MLEWQSKNKQESYPVWDLLRMRRRAMEITICILHNPEGTSGLEKQGLWKDREGLAVRHSKTEPPGGRK